MSYSHLVEPGTKVKLAKLDPGARGGLTNDEGHALTEKLAAEIAELQELMYAARQTALLLVFQGMDTAGKDGAINHALQYLNVQSCRATYFKVPTAEEAAHDFLWRVHSQTPGRGGITLFNRSHYEDVLVVRVHELVPRAVWSKRYEQINDFENLITSSDTIILKFFLHISKEEQEKRLLEREADPLKSWKLSVQDWKERELWDDYQDAYEDALTHCSTKAAPWRVIPANHKWFRDLAVAEAIAETLHPHRTEWEHRLQETGVRALEDIKAFRDGKSA